jgi:hypothetical protein
MSDFDQSVDRIISRAKGIHLARVYRLMREPDFNRRRHRRQTINLFAQFDALAAQIKAAQAEVDFAELDALLDTAAAAELTDNHLSPVLARIEALAAVPAATAARALDDSDPFGVAEEEDEEEETVDVTTLPPLVRELLGLLQTQSATIANHFETLLGDGADLSREEFLKRFDPLSFVTSCYQKALREQTTSVTDAEFAEYSQLRDFATTAAADTFFADLVALHDFIADRIGADHVVINE